MFETIHRVEIKGVVYEYNAIKSAVKIKGVYKSFMRTYGQKRTKKEAIDLVAKWEEKNPLMYKTR